MQNSRTLMNVARPSTSQTTRVAAYTARRPVTAQVDPWEPDPESFVSPSPTYSPQIDLPPLQPAQLQPAQLQLAELHSSAQPDSDLDRIDWEPVRAVRRSPESITPQGDRLQQKSVRQTSVQQKSIQHLQQLARSVQAAPTGLPIIPSPIPSIIPATIPPTDQIDAALQRLEKQAQHINQLADTQEAAILELKAIAEQIEQDWKTIELDNAARAGYDASTLEIPSLCEYRLASLPQVEKNKAGVLVLTARSIDLFKAEREAALTAQTLRHRLPSQLQSQPNWMHRLSQLRQWILGTEESAKPTQSLASRSAASQPLSSQVRRRKSSSFNRREGMTLLIGAVLVRVLLNLLLSAHPGLWFPAITLMVAPGAIALYRSTVTPRSTLTWGYRLIAVMLGFWIGGKLG
ncbi:MAG: hypothetical protein HC772_18190 [Leptolyngbyaceae cyanobacterium CRU_2_3]|nr:hypothetical protein [Leptolyngbyaceae cyanobacterium CRU_2_3]